MVSDDPSADIEHGVRTIIGEEFAHSNKVRTRSTCFTQSSTCFTIKAIKSSACCAFEGELLSAGPNAASSKRQNPCTTSSFKRLFKLSPAMILWDNISDDSFSMAGSEGMIPRDDKAVGQFSWSSLFCSMEARLHKKFLCELWKSEALHSTFWFKMLRDVKKDDLVIFANFSCRILCRF